MQLHPLVTPWWHACCNGVLQGTIPLSEGNLCVLERREMCCAPAGLLVWITRIATQSSKNICSAMETHLLWYTDEKLWNDESVFSGNIHHYHCHKHGTRCVSPEAGVALLWKYWLHWLLLLCRNQLRSGSPATIPGCCFLGRVGALKNVEEILEKLEVMEFLQYV